ALVADGAGRLGVVGGGAVDVAAALQLGGSGGFPGSAKQLFNASPGQGYRRGGVDLHGAVGNQVISQGAGGTVGAVGLSNRNFQAAVFTGGDAIGRRAEGDVLAAVGGDDQGLGLLVEADVDTQLAGGAGQLLGQAGVVGGVDDIDSYRFGTATHGDAEVQRGGRIDGTAEFHLGTSSGSHATQAQFVDLAGDRRGRFVSNHGDGAFEDRKSVV